MCIGEGALASWLPCWPFPLSFSLILLFLILWVGWFFFPIKVWVACLSASYSSHHCEAPFSAHNGYVHDQLFIRERRNKRRRRAGTPGPCLKMHISLKAVPFFLLHFVFAFNSFFFFTFVCLSCLRKTYHTRCGDEFCNCDDLRVGW